MGQLPLTFSEIDHAKQRLTNVAQVTPLLQAHALQKTRQQAWLKLENLQRTGSFKFRGAFNAIKALSSPGQPIVAWSSGNHAQGVAAAAQLLNCPAHIVMPADAPTIKINNTKKYGAEVVLYNRNQESREEIGADLAERLDALVIQPYDNLQVMAGQGTCGLEVAQQAKANNTPLDALLVCCGGGGLSAGICVAMQELSPNTHIYAVEPHEFDDHARSLASGKRESNQNMSGSICDALLAPTPGEITFAVNQQLLHDVLTVTDREVRQALRVAFETLKLV